jgi:NAD(P)-dependent dehydrogenase (short-subunit alcohol dehydrogenase family)
MRFQDRRVVVTGGTGALGGAVARALLAEGARLRIPFHRASEAERSPLGGNARVELVGPLDLADEAGVAKLYHGVEPLWASIHVAGGFAAAPLVETDAAALSRQLEQNLVSCFLCCRAAARAMPRGGGRIVNVAARPALEPRLGAGMSAYAASKAAVAALTEALGEELAPAEILVNAVAPSTMDTPANREAMPEADFTRWPKVDEVAATILFLASPENRVTRGAIVPVYGRA